MDNAVFELPAAGLVAKVPGPHQPDSQFWERMQLVDQLAEAGLPTPRLISGPIEAGELTVGLWQRIAGPHRSPDPHEVGRLLAGLHALAPPAGARLDPGLRALPVLNGLAVKARPHTPDLPWDLLHERFHRIDKRCSHPDGPPVLLHGDFHRGNLIAAERLYVIDFDGLRFGDRRYDTARMVCDLHFTGDAAQATQFASGYGDAGALDPDDPWLAFHRLASAVWSLGHEPTRASGRQLIAEHLTRAV